MFWIWFQVFSAGRDKNIWLTDLRQNDRHNLVCRESAPVLKMILTPDQVICLTSGQCCGSGSGIRCLFDSWIRDG